MIDWIASRPTCRLRPVPNTSIAQNPSKGWSWSVSTGTQEYAPPMSPTATVPPASDAETPLRTEAEIPSSVVSRPARMHYSHLGKPSSQEIGPKAVRSRCT